MDVNALHTGPAAQTKLINSHVAPAYQHKVCCLLVVGNSTPTAFGHAQAESMAVPQSSTGKIVTTGSCKVVVQDCTCFVGLSRVMQNGQRQTQHNIKTRVGPQV